jgi:hypothetical protein
LTSGDVPPYFRRAKQLETASLDTRALEELTASVELDAPEPFVTVDGLT